MNSTQHKYPSRVSRRAPVAKSSSSKQYDSRSVITSNSSTSYQTSNTSIAPKTTTKTYTKTSSQSTTQVSPIIHFNVGGRHFTTTYNTITTIPGSRLTQLFSDYSEGSTSSVDLMVDEVGRFVLDRDPDLFIHILNFYRSGGDSSTFVLPNPMPSLESLILEASYFGLDSLVELCNQHPQLSIEPLQYYIDRTYLRTGSLGNNDDEVHDTIENRLNQLAADGWEFIPNSSLSYINIEEAWGIFLFVRKPKLGLRLVEG